MRKAWPLLLSLLFLPAPAAAEAPLVKVEFTLAEPVYRDELTNAEILDLGARVVGFLTWQVGIGWVVPFRSSEVCMDTQSEIKLRTEVVSALERGSI